VNFSPNPIRAVPHLIGERKEKGEYGEEVEKQRSRAENREQRVRSRSK
jgi:hypothetical protein